MTVANLDNDGTSFTCDQDGCAEKQHVAHTYGDYAAKEARLFGLGWGKTQYLRWLCPKCKGAG